MELLWTDFVNSEWHDWRGSGTSEDRLDKPEWLQTYMEDWNLKAPIPPSPQELQALRDFRANLRRMSEELVHGEELHSTDIEYVNHLMGQGLVRRTLVPGKDSLQIRLLPNREDWPQVMAEVAASFAETIVNGEANRIRICDNADCRWVFYDETRNRSKRYCDDKLCGNLMKVRRFRSRSKQGEAQK